MHPWVPWPVGFPKGDKVAYSLEEIVTLRAPVPVAFLQPAVQAPAPAQRPEVMAGGFIPARGLAHALGRVGRGWVAGER